MGAASHREWQEGQAGRLSTFRGHARGRDSDLGGVRLRWHCGK